MTRGTIAGLLAALLVAATPAAAQTLGPPAEWDGVNPFACELQQAGFEETGPEPDLDPYCVEFDKTRQNVTDLGIVDFLLKEPGRIEAARDKCFYFQSDHWRGSLIQDDGRTVLYEWDGHYFFDRAKGNGGIWISNLKIAGIPVPTFGGRSMNDYPTDEDCAARASEAPEEIYAQP